MVEQQVVWHDHLRPIGNQQLVGSDAATLQLVHFTNEYGRVQRDPGRNDTGGIGVEDPGRHQVKGELPRRVDYRVPGIVAAMSPNNDVSVSGQ